MGGSKLNASDRKPAKNRKELKQSRVKPQDKANKAGKQESHSRGNEPFAPPPVEKGRAFVMISNGRKGHEIQ